MRLDILYRGPLESCNYGCGYCPFGKKIDTADDLATDRASLERFIEWARSQRKYSIGVLFTPWGEAAIRPWYQDAIVALSNEPHVERVAIQTNLSGPLEFLRRADRSRVALWATYHPEWTSRARFVEKVNALVDQGVRVSCGVVGFEKFHDEIKALRGALPESVYLWINAPKSSGSLPEDAIVAYERIDPLFAINTKYHESKGRSCRTGASVISVDGDGTIRRCHFVATPIGNLYEGGGVDEALAERPCTNDTCGCHIGYVHLDHLELRRVFEGGILERIPSSPIWKRHLSVVS